MTLRTEAGESVMGSARLRLREPTGSPVVEIGLDDALEDLARALVELAQRGRGFRRCLCLDRVGMTHDGGI